MKKNEFENQSIIVKKLTLYPKDEVDRTFKYIDDAMWSQNRAYNYAASVVYSAIQSRKTKEEIKRIYDRIQRTPKKDDPEYSIFPYDEFKFPVGLVVPSTVCQRLKKDMAASIKAGLLKGERYLQNRKRNAPLLVESRFMQFSHNFSSHEEFKKNLFTSKCKIEMKFVNGIVFNCDIGTPGANSSDLRMTFERIFDGTYKVAQSSIGFRETKQARDPSGKDKDAKKKREIVLNLTLKIPKRSYELDEGTVVGVDLGEAVPAAVALNNSIYMGKKNLIGADDDFLNKRKEIKDRHKRLQKRMTLAKGGHGRKRKLEGLDRLKEYEKHFAETYNHHVSREVIRFALANRAKYIHMEDLSSFSDEDKKRHILKGWSIYQLQQFITYKAEQVGITVKYVNPAYTSQNCSFCGSDKPGQRISQAEFVCKNPLCPSHDFKHGVNADFNAARNIALSDKFIDQEEKKAKKRKKGKPEEKAKDENDMPF